MPRVLISSSLQGFHKYACIISTIRSLKRSKIVVKVVTKGIEIYFVEKRKNLCNNISVFTNSIRTIIFLLMVARLSRWITWQLSVFLSWKYDIFFWHSHVKCVPLFVPNLLSLLTIKSWFNLNSFGILHIFSLFNPVIVSVVSVVS